MLVIDTDHEAVGRLAFCGSHTLTPTYPMMGKLSKQSQAWIAMDSSNTTVMPVDGSLGKEPMRSWIL